VARLAILIPPLLLAGCGDYVPAVKADRDSAKYRADLAECQKTGGKEADRRAVAFFFNFAMYPVSLPYMQRREITRCMTAKGYSLSG
jgi:hypothetical protein